METQHQYSALSRSEHESDGPFDQNDHQNGSSQPSTNCITPEQEHSKQEPVSHTANPNVTAKTSKDVLALMDKAGFDWGGSWSWEIGATSLSIIGFALLVGFLAKIHSTSYASWEYTASPNTIVSIITTITKAALLVPVSACLSQLKWNQFRKHALLYHMQTIDQSSRGPWGSAMILWRSILGLNLGYLTLLGSFLTILALAIDPFSQQILAFPSQIIHAPNETALIQSAHSVIADPSPWLDNIDGGAVASWITSSIMSGLSQTHSPLEPQCTTSNCTYPSFITLGVCTRCEDVTTQTNQSCQKNKGDAFGQFGQFFNKIPIDCIYRWSGLELNITTEELNFWSDGSGALKINPYLNTNTSQSRIFGIQSPLLSFLEAKQTTVVNYNSSNIKNPPPTPSLTACTIYYCEKEYSSSNYSGQNTHSVNISATQQLVPPDFRATTGNFSPPNGSETLSTNSNYTINDWVTGPLPNVLNAVFSLNAKNEVYLQGGLSMRSILSSCNLTQCLDSLSTSMTDTFRSLSTSERLPGKAFVIETFIKVRWWWIILLAIVILGSCSLLLATALSSRRQHAVLWKDSVLPLIMSRLDTTPEHEIAPLRSVSEVQSMSKKMQVTMEQDAGALAFTEKRN